MLSQQDFSDFRKKIFDQFLDGGSFEEKEAWRFSFVQYLSEIERLTVNVNRQYQLVVTPKCNWPRNVIGGTLIMHGNDYLEFIANPTATFPNVKSFRI